MDGVYFILILILFIQGLGAAIIYLLITRTIGSKKMKKEILRRFEAKERDDELYIKFRGYDVIITLKPRAKVSILHNRDVEGIRSPKGAKLTPLYLIFPIKSVEEIGEKLDEYIDFLESIPTR